MALEIDKRHTALLVMGTRFLFLGALETTASTVRREPTIVLNWVKELDKIVPAK